jgi:AraC-like DNA-binding protein
VDVLSDVITAVRTGQPHSSRTHWQAPWTFVGEPFSGIGFHVVLQGSCLLTRPSHEPVVVATGDVVCLPPRKDAYRLTDKAGEEAVLLCGAYFMDQTRAHPLLAELPEVIHLPARLGRYPSLRGAVDLLGTELESPRPGSDAIVPALLDTLLLYVLRAWYDEHHHHGWAGALSDPGISAALKAIHGKPEHPWTVEELGAEAGLSRAAFSKRFGVLVGQPPLTYLTWWRMTTAARLLRDSDAPLGSVAAKTGYASEFAFAKAFKRTYGVAPGGYRRAGR